jgi:hypothetical protein
VQVIIIQLLCPIVLIAGYFFIPESPRWLIGKGREEEATKALQYLRRGTNPTAIAEEVRLIAASEVGNNQKFQNSWADCFK